MAKRPAAKTASSASSLPPGPLKHIRVRGAREHNLRDLDVDIPRDCFVVITGLSGSGKSSLAFDTIFAEGQRKYMESLSSYARQFLDQMKRPDVDRIEGLPPTIAIEQRSSGHNPRSTVATATEIYDYLRVLFARAGQPTCWAKDGATRCGTPITASSPPQIRRAIEKLPDGSKLMLLGPVVRDRKGYHREVLEDLLKQGFVRARVDGKVVALEDALADGGENPLELGRYEKHSIEAVVDRLTLKEGIGPRLSESLETALKLGKGTVIVHRLKETGGEDLLFSENYACPHHPDHALSELEPRLFSFNSPQGACETCHGLGAILEFDPARILPNPDASVGHGGIAPFKRNGPAGMFAGRWIRRFCKASGVTKGTTIGALTPEQRKELLYGDAAAGYKWEGVIPLLEEWFEKTESTKVREFLHTFMDESPCPSCLGDRLSPRSLGVLLRTRAATPDSLQAQRRAHSFVADAHSFNIADLTRLTVADAIKVLADIELGREAEAIAAPILNEVRSRLGFLASVGLEYMSLDRRINTLSGGEAQRIRLATQVGSGIVGAAYVLDEPTIGLHPRDNDRLLRTLRRLADIGNTVLVVEHDEEVIRAADHILDIGPGPGRHGGQVVVQGDLATIQKHKTSLTAAYLSGRRAVTPPARRRQPGKKWIRVEGARAHNLKSLNAAFPCGLLTVVTGVSGSGKSTLVNDVLLKAARAELNGSRERPGEHKRIRGLEHIERLIEVDQSPIGRTPRSNPATYTGMFDEIRKLFALVPEARARGYQVGRFSFNVRGGRCEACQGQGLKRIEMHFLPDVFVDCEVCGGTRYAAETLDIRFRGMNIAEVLAMSIEDATRFFENHPKIVRYAQALLDVGLGYITLGQPSTTLSGGEAQRVKLAAELGRGRQLKPGVFVPGLYILDEPTTGLHFEDVRKLVEVMHQLVEQGHTVVVIEHNLDVIKCADWILDLGPEGGAGGGTLVAEGSPDTIASHATSHTGRFLAPLLRAAA